MDDKIIIEVLTKENELLKAQNDEIKDLLIKQTENSLTSVKVHNYTIRWFLFAITLIIVWLIAWLLGGYFFSDYQDHNVVNNSNVVDSSGTSINNDN